MRVSNVLHQPRQVPSLCSSQRGYLGADTMAAVVSTLFAIFFVNSFFDFFLKRTYVR